MKEIINLSWLRGLLFFILINSSFCSAQRQDSKKVENSFDWSYYISKANYYESKVPLYILPDPLVMSDGEIVKDRLTWLEKRRPEILELYKNEVYGRIPEWEGRVRFETIKTIANSLNGKATMKEVRAWFINKSDSVKMDMLIFLPNGKKEKYPLFLGLNFFGNHSIHPNPNITIAEGYVINKKAIGVSNHQAAEAARGVRARRWPVEKLIENGYGLATVFCDYFETDSAINENKVAVLGHSRLGKAALWAGAQDKRFAVTISNNSGSGGAALFRRKFGETINVSVAYAPQWYCDNFKKYNEDENTLPLDQHLLLSLIAPRPVYVASAKEDIWADPKGEFLSAKYASSVYELFNKKGIETEEMPKVNQAQMNQIAYHIRSGNHDVTGFDWDNYITFADMHFSMKKKIALTFDDGPDSLYTEKILDILKRQNVRATFFLLGKNVKKYPQMVKRIQKENHLIGNHTFTHPHLNRIIDKDSVLTELAITDSLLKNITKTNHQYFRPSYGHLTKPQKIFLEKKGYKVTMWDIDPKDWNVDATTKDDIVNAVKKYAFDGANILLHSTNASSTRPKRFKNLQNTVGALPEIIQYLKDKEYTFVTIEDFESVKE